MTEKGVALIYLICSEAGCFAFFAIWVKIVCGDMFKPLKELLRKGKKRN